MDPTDSASSAEELDISLWTLNIAPPLSSTLQSMQLDVTPDVCVDEEAERVRRREFQLELINYIVRPDRILFAGQPQTWRHFRSADPSAGDCPELLCAEFMTEVLPHILEYALSEEHKRCVQVLDVHPELVRVPQGYACVPRERRVAHAREPKPGRDYQVLEPGADEELLMDTGCCASAESDCDSLSQPEAEDEKQSTHTHTWVVPESYQLPRSGYDFQFSKENAAILSAALSTDYELSGCALLEPEEIHKRLRQAKGDFEQKARMPENIANGPLMLEKLKRLYEMRQALTNLISKRYM